MASQIQPVSDSNFSFSDGDYVWVVDRSGTFLQGGRVFLMSLEPSYEFVSEADMNNSSSVPPGRDYVALSAKSKVPVAYVTLRSGGAVKVFKAYCPVCGHYVIVPGHPDRCADNASLHAQADVYRRLAWLGDALHLMDVRIILLNMGVSSAELDTRLQGYTRASAQATYLKSLLDDGVPVPRPPLGSSERQLSTSFEASYAGAFRTMYLRTQFGKDPPSYSLVSVASLDSLVTSAPPTYAG